jgi:cytosine/creatinine deaminase
MNDLLVTNVRPWARGADDPAVDLLVRDGRIAAIGDHASARSEAAGSETVDGAGGVMIPAFTDAHTHLDSTLLGLPFRPHSAEPGLAGLILNDRTNWRDAPGTVASRAAHTLGVIVAAGATSVRSHAQVDTDSGLERLEGVLEARDVHAGRCRVQVVAFPQSGVLADPGTADLLDAAVRAGADLIGGIDPADWDGDAAGQLDILFGLATRHQVPLDIHLHETGDRGAATIGAIATRVAANGMAGHVTISHAFALSTVDIDRQRELVDLLATHDIAITTVAPGPRDPLPLDALREAGVRVGLGQDGIRDFWSPYGTGDMLERCWQLAYRAGYRHDELIEGCVDIATRGGRAVLDGGHCPVGDIAADPVAGLGVGAPAELVIIPADSVTAAVMDRPNRRIVIHEGRVVAGEPHQSEA